MCVCVCVCVCVCTCVQDTHVRMLCAYFALLSPTPCTTLSSLLSPRPLLPAVFSLHVSRSFSGRCGWERAARGTRHRVPRNVRERQTLFGGPWTLEREREREREGQAPVCSKLRTFECESVPKNRLVRCRCARPRAELPGVDARVDARRARGCRHAASRSTLPCPLLCPAPPALRR